MSKVDIGKTAAGKKIAIDLELLLSTRLLVTADSGGGKTWLLKRICEQAADKVQIIIIDPEGEFAPLRTKLPFFLAGKGGETPMDVRSAEKLALTLMKTRARCVCDLYEMKASERHVWVRLFLEALLEAPKHLRHPCLVIVDEAHMFCPEKGAGSSEASDAMKGLCTRGRKRLLCPIFATQRLAELDKGASGMLLNRLIGPTFENINRETAAKILGIAQGKKDKSDFYREIMALEPGNFFALGRAISRELTVVHVGGIETPHGQEATKYELDPPPPPEEIRKLLPTLADLPKQAEEEAKTAAEFKKQIRELKAELRVATAAVPKAVNQKLTTVSSDPRAIERAVTDATRKLFQWTREIVRDRDSQFQAALKQLSGEIARLGRLAFPAPSLDAALSVTKVSGGEIQTKGKDPGTPAARLQPERPKNAPAVTHPRPNKFLRLKFRMAISKRRDRRCEFYRRLPSSRHSAERKFASLRSRR